MWHVLALALGGRTKAEWRKAMTEDEFLDWCVFYQDQPFDDLHRFHRPAALIAGSLGGGDMQERLDWLQPPPDDGLTNADRDLFKAAGAIRRG